MIFFIGTATILIVLLFLATKKRIFGENGENAKKIKKEVRVEEKKKTEEKPVKKGGYLKKIWYYIFFVVPISGLLLVFLLIPVGHKVYKSVLELITTNSYEGTYSWVKADDLGGYNPACRGIVPKNVTIKITRDGKKMSFVMKRPSGKYYFHGNKIPGQWASRRKFSGDWNCPERDIGGTLEIEETSNQSGIFEGILTGQRGERVNSRLVINN